MNKVITAFFTNNASPATGLSPTIKIIDLSDNSVAISDVAMTEVGSGFYKYTFTTYDADNNYAIRCDGSATLSGSERYTFGGNESYLQDIWDVSTANHVTSGTMGGELRANGGLVVTGEGGSRRLTKREMDAIAEAVWEFILDNKETAAHTLLTRSDFNTLTDVVLLEKDIESQDVRLIVQTELSTLIDKFPEILRELSIIKDGVLDKELVNIDTLLQNIQALRPAIDSIANIINSNIGESKKSMQEVVSSIELTNSSITGVQRTVSVLDAVLVSLESITNILDKMGDAPSNHREMLGEIAKSLINIQYAIQK